MTVLNLPGGEAHFADNENDPNCLPMDNFTITNEHTQSPCLQLELEPLDTGAAIAVGAIGILWILGGIYLAMYHSMHGPHHHRGRRQQQPRRGECSESGDTEADSTWDVESVCGWIVDGSRLTLWLNARCNVNVMLPSSKKAIQHDNRRIYTNYTMILLLREAFG
eukprot:scaffold161_cov172-Amphora_coffeaeformis.AAC.2